jgi:transcriptional regulator with XRE-family HTH domain
VPSRKGPPPDLEPFGEVIRAFRLKTGLSQERFAIRHDFDRSSISALERGTRNVAVGGLRPLLAALGITWEQFGRAMDEAYAARERQPRRSRRHGSS